MQHTKKQVELAEKLSKYNLLPNQLEPICKLFSKHKDEVISLDQAQRFKEINEGKRVRDFLFVYINGCNKKRGVYKITFDSKKFYIGRSKYIDTRIKQHSKALTDYFTSGSYIPDHYLSKVFDHLKENQFGYFFEVRLLEECYSVDELQIKEQKWLDRVKDNHNCLNIGFIAAKPIREIDETLDEQLTRKSNTGVVKRGGRFIFYPKKKIEVDVLDKRLESVKKYTPFKKEQATSYSFNVPELNSTNGATVYKLFYGDIYIINKGKTLAGSLFLLQKGLGYFLAYDHSKESKFDKDYYHKFYDYIRTHPGKEFRVEILFQSDDGYEILKNEQIYLNQSMRDKKCFNNNIHGYIPTLNGKTQMHGWITKDQVSRFWDFLASI